MIRFQTSEGRESTPNRILKPLPIPKWKWEVTLLDFITRIPKTQKQRDEVMLVVDKLTKFAHFILV